MSIIRWKLTEELKELVTTNVTYGYITKINRNEISLEKSHSNDAFIISGGKGQERCKEVLWFQKQMNHRAIQLNRKGYRPSVRKRKYPIQNHDLIWIGTKMERAKGCQNLGTRVLYNDKDKNKTVKLRQVTRFYNLGGI